MPMVRYEIRNEYSLADPELYRAADKDDPEDLLEGVAMAGLVGVLRQLGDLAEFAAEVFHDLHEEVMATAARGHGLMIRVQQLETEVPSIEKAFLSQTDHSSFFYHAGVDWHPNLQIDQNLVTQRDLPRFIMDSYEECRAPPRLFLLDKFDVAGAGACLKRYTDPSFFKVETSEMATSDFQREKKIRKAKKKGPRWRNGETPEVQPTSHAKLHQLFMEERVENGIGNPYHRAQLRRRLNGFPFDSKTGKSYMEKLLKSPSPDHKVLHEVTVNSSPQLLATSDHKKSVVEVPEVRPVSPDRENVGRRSPPSPDRDEIMPDPSMYGTREVPIDDNISESPTFYPSIGTDSISSTKVTGEKVIAVDAESSRHDRLTGDQSDGVASEVDNYVDAPSTMDPEMDMDSEFRGKSDFVSSHGKNEPLASDADEEHFHTSSSDSQSTGDTTISDEGNNSCTKEDSSSSSDSPSTSAENPHSEELSGRGFPSADIPEIEIVDASFHAKTVGEDFIVDQQSKSMVPFDTCPGTDAISNHKSDSEQLTPCLCSNQSTYATESSDSGVMQKNMFKGPESDEMASSLDDREQQRTLAINLPSSPSISDFESQLGDDSLRSSAVEPMDDPNGEVMPSISTIPGIHSHAADGLVTISSDLLHEDEADEEHGNLVENIASPLHKFSALSVNRNGVPDDEFSKLPKGFASDYPDIAYTGDNINSTVSKEEYPIDELDNANSNVSSDAPNSIPSNLGDFLGKKLEETSQVNAQTVDAEDTRSNSSTENKISSGNVTMLHLAEFLDWPEEGSDAHKGDVIPEEVTTVNETLPLGTPKTCEVVGLQGAGMAGGISPKAPKALGSSFSTPEDLEEPREALAAVETDGITPCMNSTGQEVPEISASADPELVSEVCVLLDESHSNADKSDESHSNADKSHTAETASAVSAVSENAIADNFLDKLVEDHIHCIEDSGLDELENDKNCLSGSHGEASVVEKVSQTKDATLRLETVFCNTTDDDHPKSEVSDTVLNTHLEFEVDEALGVVHSPTIQSLDTEQEVFQQSSLGNIVSNSLSFPVDYEAEESIEQEKVGSPPSEADQEAEELIEQEKIGSPPSQVDQEAEELIEQEKIGSPASRLDQEAEESTEQEKFRSPPSQLDQKMPYSGEISSDLSPSLPKNQQQMPVHDDCKGNNNSVSDISRPSNYGLSVPEYPKDQLGFVLPPSNPFFGTNQINVVDLPPLPPLPPVQWRTGKLQHALSSTDGETTNHKELIPQLISPPTASTNDVNSFPVTTSTDTVYLPLPTASTVEASFLLEEAKDSLVQIASETASEEKVENSCSNLTDGMIPETASNEEKVENSCSSLEASIIPETISKEDKVENSCSTLETNVLHETVDLPPKMESKQQLVMPTSESEFASPVEEDGVANGNRTVKQPWPRNPLIEDVAALDKSKLRKVTERVRRQTEKVDERDSLLEQIRTKSFNLKPAMASRPAIRGPNTNLRVAAILEKANAIRQAFAGSDEDDDDSWSDS